MDCDGDGILDHACSTTINNNRWLVLSSEGCPNSWGSASRPASKCPQAFGGIVVFRKNILIPINLLQIYQLPTSDFFYNLKHANLLRLRKIKANLNIGISNFYT